MTGRSAAAARLALAAAALALMTGAVRPDRVDDREAELFRAVNELPDGMYRPVWAVMQLGTLGAAPAAAAVAWIRGDRRLAARLLLAGSATWALSKAFKRGVGRPRPAALVPGTRVRGADAAGLGYVSGHAGVAVALAAAALPGCGSRARLVMLGLVPVVGAARMYVGAHLPLDVAAGQALGLGVEAAVFLLLGERPAG